MADDSFSFDEDEAVDDLVDMDIAGKSDDDDDDEFNLAGYDDLGIQEEKEENHIDDMEEDGQGFNPKYNDTATGKKRKRAKPTASTSLTARVQADKAEAFILNEDTVISTEPSSRIPGTFGRLDRKRGDTLPAYHKRVSHELDSDDELMMAMREKGFSDRQIAEKLAKDGRIRYDQKSISTRIMRIRLAQAENVDFLLDEGYKEWEFEDDVLLMQAYALADIETSYEIERIRAWRHRKVSEYLRRLNKESLFSADACRKRYSALVDGTAIIPTELDDDPAARRLEQETYRESRELARNKVQAEKDAKAANELKAKDEALTRNAQKSEEIAFKRQQIEDGKAQRAMQRAVAAQLRFERAGQNTLAKIQRNTQIQKRQKQKEYVQKNAPKSKAHGRTTITTKHIPNPINSLDLSNAEITANTPDPRSYLAQADLIKMCASRGLSPLGKTKVELLADLKDADAEWSKPDLEKMCKSKRLNANGTKLQMKYHLALDAAKKCKSFRAGVEAMATAKKDTVMDEEE